MRKIESSSLVAAGFGTLINQVAGFHRAVPSTALDKACMQLPIHYSEIKKIVKPQFDKLFTNLLWTFVPIAGKMEASMNQELRNVE